MIQLKRGELLRMQRRAGSTLRAHAGAVWVTEQASPRDVVLRAGESFRLAHPGLALVEAFSDASISIDP